MVEAMASFCAVNLCKTMGYQNVYLEVDVKVICDALKNRSSNTCRYGYLLEDIRVVMFSFNQWQCTHICYEANGAAHILAWEALNHIRDRSWEDVMPASINQIIST